MTSDNLYSILDWIGCDIDKVNSQSKTMSSALARCQARLPLIIFLLAKATGEGKGSTHFASETLRMAHN